jgi:amidase
MRSALDRRQISGAELWQAHADQIHRMQPLLHCFTKILEPPTGATEGALAGIPISIKDSLDVKGEATVCGHVARQSHRASKDALCVDRLRRAGAIVVGKTNTPEFLMNWETFNDVYGVTRNPWSLAHTPGGSSGGESAAIAAGMSAGGIGSDGGGSIRLPAALTGICGLKPTPGRVPATGHFPPVGHPGGLLGVIGPMARNVQDVATIFRVVEGHADSDPFSVPLGDRSVLRKGRVGIVAHPHTEICLRWVEEEPVEFAWQAWERIYEVWRFFFLRVNAHLIGFATPHTEVYLEQEAPTMAEVMAMLAARDSLRSHFLDAMKDVDLVLLPNPGFGAWKHGEFPGVNKMAPLTVANLLGLPALAIPVGLNEEGLPISVQALGKPWSEETLLEFGEKMEEARGRFASAPIARES